MIFYGAQGQASPAMTGDLEARYARVAGIYMEASPSTSTPPVETSANGGDASMFQPTQMQSVAKTFDWSKKRTDRIFSRLEQKVLANVATAEEIANYRTMKRDRNSKIFADRQLRDYEEVRRLKQLSEKLAELQQYVRPIKLG